MISQDRSCRTLHYGTSEVARLRGIQRRNFLIRGL